MTRYDNPFGGPLAGSHAQDAYPPGGGYSGTQQAGYPSGGYAQPGYPQGGYPQGGYPPGMGPGGPVGAGGPGGPGGPKKSGNTLLIAAIAVLAVVALGTIGFVVLGGDDSDGGDEAEVRTDLTLADLEPALLTAGDVPEGYTAIEWSNDDEDTLTPDQIDGSAECEEVLERFSMSDGARDETGAEFEAENGGSIENTLSVAVPNDITVDEVREGINTCGTFGYTDEGQTGQITMSAEPVDGIGDSALLVTMVLDTSAEGYDVTVEMNGILWDRSGVHSSVAFTGGFEDDALSGTSLESLPIDQEALRTAAETVDARLQPIVDG